MSSPLNSPLEALKITSEHGLECDSDGESVYSSDSSRTGVSDSSTLVYSHEPYETFQSQVLQLCHDLWPTLYQKYTIERLKGGSYNRIIGINVFGTDPINPARLILRVPRFPDERVDRELATLHFVRQKTKFPVPEVIAFDLTSNNALGKHYMIQNRLPGASLRLVYPDLNNRQKCSVAAQWGRLLLDLHSHSSPVAGLIENSTESIQDQDFKVVQFDVGDVFNPAPKINCRSADVPGSETTLGMLEIQFNRWIADARSLDASDDLTVDLMISLLAVAREMDQLGYFDDDNNVLCHLDLEPRNILLSLEPQVTISGILDWDSAVFAPIFMSCAPPFWLWGWDDEIDEDEKHANDIPPTANLQEIKRTFEDVVGSKILRYTYMAQYRLARRLFQAAISGINSNEAYKEILDFLKEWDELKLQNGQSINLDRGRQMWLSSC